MAVYSIDEVLEKVKDQKLREILASAKHQHEQLGNEIYVLLQKYGDETKEPGAMAKGMSWIKTNAKLAVDDSDHVCADLITDGCNMGIKTLNKYLNQYLAAENKAKDLTKDLIHLEENLVSEMEAYL